MAASSSSGVTTLFRPLAVLLAVVVGQLAGRARAYWCVARSNVSEQVLQTALDYACGAGADCAPIQSTGLCYLPNTLPAHASYAFNSFYQRKATAPGSCDFSGTAVVAMTDPSYGSCVYPSSPSTAGGTVTSPGANTPGTAPIGGGGPVIGGGSGGAGGGTVTGGGGGTNVSGGFSPLGPTNTLPSRASSNSFSCFPLTFGFLFLTLVL
ncbi:PLASMODESMATA CALLOSE-BINDING PROTEIN 3-like [Aristolochia californica]|uniref:PLASMODESMATA CALLOSE-BINDING PROTEIN 3-like n=1 Tax=Aristolochia californica TaxID=171875 RepID=UPI0035E28EDC